MSAVADIFREAARHNRDDPRRKGCIVEIEDGCRVTVTGDLHGNRRNFTKVLAHASLAPEPSRRLVLQEIIHGPHDPVAGYDRSIEVAMRAARLKNDRPEQVLFLMGNHDLAEFTGGEITRAGQGSCKCFRNGVREGFRDEADAVLEGLYEFLRSLPLAIRCPNGVWISHSLPAPNRMEMADPEVFSRALAEEDCHRGHAAYEWTWGRGHTVEQVRQLAQQLGVSFFVIGHQHVPEGWQSLDGGGIILASDHPQGCIFEFDSSEPVTPESVPGQVRRINAL